MEIREALGEIDFEEIRDLVLEEWPLQFGNPTDDEKIEEFEKSGDPANDVNKILYIDGERAGWYRYSRWPREETNAVQAHTLDIIVKREYRGKGYGIALMNDMVRDCKSKGFKKLMSRTFLDNEASIRLHIECGFSESFRNRDSIIWELKLSD